MLKKKVSLVLLCFTMVFSLLVPSAFAGSSNDGLLDQYSFGSASPFGLAYHDGYIYGASRNTNQIVRVSTATGAVEVVAKASYAPMAVAVNSQGDIFYTQDSDTKIYKIPAASLANLPADGLEVSAAQTFATLTGLNYLYGLAVDPNDHLYVSAYSTKSIYRLDSTGVPVTVMSTGKSSLYAISFDLNGDLYISDNSNLYKINKSDLDSNVSTDAVIDLAKLETVQSTYGQYGMVFLSNGSLYVPYGNSIIILPLPNRDITAATALLPSSLTVEVDSYSNLLTYLQQLDGMSSKGVTLSLASSNSNVANDGTITHTGADVTGNVTVHVNKTNETEATKTIAVTVIGIPTVTNAVYTATDKSITLNWNNPSIPTDGIKIVSGTEEVTTSESADSYTFTGLIPNTEYEFTLYALYANGAESAGVTVTASTLPLTIIALTANPDSINLRVGRSASADITATYSDDSTINVTDAVIWSSLNPNVASVTDTGIITGEAVGSTTVIGEYNGHTVQIPVTIKAKDQGTTTPSDNTATPTPAPTPSPTPAPNTSIFNNSAVHSDEDVLNHLQSAVQSGGSTSVFSDVAAHWAKEAIAIFNKLQVTNGYSDGSFKPNAPVTRAEFAVWIDRVFNISADGAKQVVLNDIDQHWAQATIEKLASSGVLNGYGTDFRPNQTITRAEMVAIISRIVNMSAVPANGSTTAFSDISESFAAEQITAAANAGIISGKGDGRFDPNTSSTRAEALTILLNTIKLDPQIQAFLDTLK